jgi:glycosyltransferase involved in cell wall biosynthesis
MELPIGQTRLGFSLLKTMHQPKPKVLLGPISDDPAESVSAVNRAFLHGLAAKYDFIVSTAHRQHGGTRQSRLNAWNLWYLIKHLSRWVYNLLRHRPAVAHYAVSSGWAFEKSLLSLWLAAYVGSRTVGHLHSGGFLLFWNKLPRWRRRLAALQLNRLDALVVLSESWRQTMIQQVGVRGNALHVVNNPIDQQFEEAAMRLPVARIANSVLSLGVMGRDKGVLEIISAVKVLKDQDVELRMLAVGPEREPGIHERLRRMVQEDDLEDYVAIRGSAWGTDKIELFRNASIFLLPSYYENFPLVVLEAAAAGLAIIVTPVGAVPEFFVDGVSAIFVEPGNVPQITQALKRLILDPAERLRLGNEARKVFCERLARKGIMESMDAVYKQVLKTTDGRGQ